MSIVKSVALSSFALLAVLAGCSSASESPSDLPLTSDGVSTQKHENELAPDSQAGGIHWTRDEKARRDAKAGGASRTRSPNLVNHGGKIMTTANSKAIFWGPKWADSTYVGDKVTGIDAWYAGHAANSNYAKTVNEYSGTNGQIASTTMAHQGHVVDTSTAAGGGTSANILAEVCKQAAAGSITVDPSGNGYYPVYTDVPRGSAGYCAYHGSGTCAASGSTVLQYAFFWSLDGDAGCDPQDTQTGHSEGLAALGSVTAHELSEARSDPSTIAATGSAAWYDSSGSENGDKCAWTFNVPFVTFSNGTSWKLQGEWSNAAYTGGTGYPNSSGQRGCVDGH